MSSGIRLCFIYHCAPERTTLCFETALPVPHCVATLVFRLLSVSFCCIINFSKIRCVGKLVFLVTKTKVVGQAAVKPLLIYNTSLFQYFVRKVVKCCPSL